VAGFLIDAWSEAMPLPRRDTGLVVHHNAPNTCAPQAVLLAVAPDTGVATWSTATLAQVLRDTAATAASGVVMRYLLQLFVPPLTHLGQRSDGSAMGFH
jgi:hypothetical protein